MKNSVTVDRFLSNCMCVIFALLSICGNDRFAGTGSTTESGTIVGLIIDGTTGKAAGNAEVKCIPTQHIPTQDPNNQTGIFTLFTDSKGQFAFKNLESNTYNIISQKDSLRAFSGSLCISPENMVSITDTLLPQLSLYGKVQLIAGDDARTVLIMVQGTTIFTYPVNSAGDFIISNIAAGNYTIRFLSTIDTYRALDTTLTVPPGNNDTLSSPIVLPYFGIPVVDKPVATWDSLTLIANIIWQIDTQYAVAGYNIYRCKEDEFPTGIPLNTALITDNMFTDTSCELNNSYVYYVKALNKNGFSSPHYSRPDTIKTFQAYKVLRPVPEKFTMINGNNLLVLQNNNYYFFQNDSTIAHFDTLGNVTIDFLYETFDSTRFNNMSNSPILMFIVNNIIKVVSHDKICTFTFNGLCLDTTFLPVEFLPKKEVLFHPSQDSTVLENFEGKFCFDSIGNTYYTKEDTLWQMDRNGFLTSMILPVNQQYITPNTLKCSGNQIFIGNGFECSDPRCISQIAFIQTGTLLIKSIHNLNWAFRIGSIDSEGNLCLLLNNYQVVILSPDLKLIAKFNIPHSQYIDIAFGDDGTIHLFDDNRNKIVRYNK